MFTLLSILEFYPDINLEIFQDVLGYWVRCLIGTRVPTLPVTMTQKRSEYFLFLCHNDLFWLELNFSVIQAFLFFPFPDFDLIIPSNF